MDGNQHIHRSQPRLLETDEEGFAISEPVPFLSLALLVRAHLLLLMISSSHRVPFLSLDLLLRPHLFLLIPSSVLIYFSRTPRYLLISTPLRRALTTYITSRPPDVK